jgi:hypothetical protein
MNVFRIVSTGLLVAASLMLSQSCAAQHSARFAATDAGVGPRTATSHTESMSAHGNFSRIGRPAGLSRSTASRGMPGGGAGEAAARSSSHFVRMPTAPQRATVGEGGATRGASPRGTTRRPAPSNSFRIGRVTSGGAAMN